MAENKNFIRNTIVLCVALVALVAISWYFDYLNVTQLIGVVSGNIVYSYATFTELVALIIADLLVYSVFSNYYGRWAGIAAALLVTFVIVGVLYGEVVLSWGNITLHWLGLIR